MITSGWCAIVECGNKAEQSVCVCVGGGGGGLVP